MSSMSVMDGTGDTRLQWNKNKADEVEAAQKRFDELKAKGYKAWKLDARDRNSEQISAFDPDAERIVMIPQFVGG